MKRIDAHCVIGDFKRGATAPEAILEDMRLNGIDQAVIVPDDVCAAVDNAKGNEQIINAVERNPDKFIGFATVNPWYGEQAARMLKQYLKRGLRGVYFKSTVQGFMPDDEMLWPLLDICSEYKVPALFHTGTPVNALPFTVMTQALRYPNVDFILGHMGANDYLGDAYAAVRLCDNIYLETSLNLTLSIRAAVKTRAERVLFGSGSPRSRMDFEFKKLYEAVPDSEKQELVLFRNMESILGGRK
ncbi:MAG TPA: amidohydrolase family protein [Clostridia bacterium]|nr:amidohydrolase family protein [Clostridia bacterium]